jgi:hypothetical protein
LLLELLAQFVEGGIRRRSNPIGQPPQLVCGELGVCPPAVGQRGDSAAVPLLAQQFVNEGFVHAEQGRDLPFAADLPLYGLNDSCAKV